jgi:hypothetical protein
LAGCLAVYQSDLVPSLGYTLKVEMKVTLLDEVMAKVSTEVMVLEVLER